MTTQSTEAAGKRREDLGGVALQEEGARVGVFVARAREVGRQAGAAVRPVAGAERATHAPR